jgi:Tol biopolymer transport system component
MYRQRIPWLALVLLILTSLACNAFAGTTEPGITLPPPPPIITETASPIEPEGNVADELAPTATVPTEVVGEVTVVPFGAATVTMLVDLNVRAGPGVQYDRISFMYQDESARILGMDPATGWWKIECPPREDAAECWVSGGGQYTSVTDTADVPVAAVPPTPTPIPPTLTPDADVGVLAVGLLVYESEGRLLATNLDLGQDPPTAGEPRLLTENANPMTPFISPDGQRIVYLVNKLEKNEIHVINVSGEDDRMLISSDDLPVLIEENTAILFSQLQWLNNSQELAFSTSISNLVGPGQSEREDLWTVGLDGVPTQRFPEGKGGGFFAISPNNQVIMSQPQSIVRANLDGSDFETVITFESINTASEYVYYPRPQWTADGSYALVAIPGPEPFAFDATAALYMIPSIGPAESLREMSGNILFNPVVWSDDGESLAYVQQLMSGVDDPPLLMLGDGDGLNLADYIDGEGLRFHGWSPDGNYFLFSTSGSFAIGQPGGPEKERVLSVGTAGAQWLSNTAFVVATGTGDTWRLDSENLSAGSSLLAIISAESVRYDVWTP